MPLRPLSPIEARVLGTLMEKARTVPDSYPLSLNSLVMGCNQKTSRDPLMEVTDAQAQEALDALRLLSLVFESSGSRVTRWEHNIQRVLTIPEQSAVLLGLLVLRGPQTAGELRINSERWYRFADISSVEGFLEELRDRADDKGGPLAVLLPRAPGAREPRWTNLLCGMPAQVHGSSGATKDVAPDIRPADNPALAGRVEMLESEVAALRATVQKICEELGLSHPAHRQ